MRINYNIAATITHNALRQSDNALEQTMERLSSGFKINHAKDNPAGLAMAKRMKAQIEGLSLSSDNANDAISVIETAEGALAEMQDMLQRMNELSIQAANGSNTTSDREAIQEEVTQLSQEIARVARDTDFNGQQLLNGNFDVKGYCTNSTGIEVSDYSDEVIAGKYEIRVLAAPQIDLSGNVINEAQIDISATFPPDAQVEYNGTDITIKRSDGFELNFKIDPSVTPDVYELDLMGIGAMRVQIGANEGQVLEIRIPEISLEKLGVENMDCTTLEGARESMAMAKEGVAYISAVRSRLGAYQNRLDHTDSSLEVTHENMTAAYARIMDTNMAEEMTEMTKNQILSQAGTSMLAQANERPQQILQLIQ